MAGRRHDLVMPDLGLPGVNLTASAWLSDVGARVYEGDRLLEICAGEVTIDLPSPATGILVDQSVGEDDEVHLGQVLGVVEALVDPTR